jgi:acyl carrier protein
MTDEEARAIIEDEIRHIVPDADFAEMTDDAELREELELDSLDFLVLIERLCLRAHCRIDESDYPALRSMGGGIRLLVTRTSPDAAAQP